MKVGVWYSGNHYYSHLGYPSTEKMLYMVLSSKSFNLSGTYANNVLVVSSKKIEIRDVALEKLDPKLANSKKLRTINPPNFVKRKAFKEVFRSKAEE